MRRQNLAVMKFFHRQSLPPLRKMAADGFKVRFVIAPNLIPIGGTRWRLATCNCLLAEESHASTSNRKLSSRLYR